MKIIRKFRSSHYILKDSRIENGYKDTFWIECDEKGNVLRDNPKTMTLLCKIPEGYQDLDLTTLSEDCLTKSKSKK